MAQCKQAWLNFDLNFTSKCSGAALLKTIVSCQTPSLSEKQESPSLSASRHINNSLSVYLFSARNCSWANQKNSTMKKWKCGSRELLKAIFCYQKIIKKHVGYFKIKAPIFYCHLFFEEYLKQDQQDG